MPLKSCLAPVRTAPASEPETAGEDEDNAEVEEEEVVVEVGEDEEGDAKGGAELAVEQVVLEAAGADDDDEGLPAGGLTAGAASGAAADASVLALSVVDCPVGSRELRPQKSESLSLSCSALIKPVCCQTSRPVRGSRMEMCGNSDTWYRWANVKPSALVSYCCQNTHDDRRMFWRVSFFHVSRLS